MRAAHLALATLAAGAALAGPIRAEAAPLQLRWETASFVGSTDCSGWRETIAVGLYEDCVGPNWGAQSLPDPGYAHFSLDGTPLTPPVPTSYRPITVVHEYGVGTSHSARNAFVSPIPRSFVSYGTKSLQVGFRYGPTLWALARSTDIIFLDTPGAAIPIVGIFKGRDYWGDPTRLGTGEHELAIDPDLPYVFNSYCHTTWLGGDPLCQGYVSRLSTDDSRLLLQKNDGVFVTIPVSVERRFRVTDTPDTLSAPETPDGAS